ncbi:MAG: MBL fold metallo-hydrolase [Planctomycetes bacterium]|nr:MBL fold metallo-hydrolase [Planctomycetota bacterium]
MNQERGSRKMKRVKKITLAVTVLLVLSFILFIIGWRSSLLQRLPFSAPEASYRNWDDILLHPKPITIRTYSTGMMQTPLSGIMNLKHEQAQDINDELVEFPVIANLIQHQELGSYLIDAGLDASYAHNPHGSMKGILVKTVLGKATQDPNTHIAAILNRENIHLQGVLLTHLHFDHTAGILDLPKDIPYIMGKDELYTNFTFFMRGDHLAGIGELYEIDFATGIDLPPFGKSVDVFGDGSLWAISSSGHSKGHVLYFVNGIEAQVLVTGDACNTQYQFDSGIGPGYFSSDLEQAQDVLDRIKVFKERYPKVKLVFGHDLPSR